MKKQIRLIVAVFILLRPEMNELITQSFPKHLLQSGIFIK